MACIRTHETKQRSRGKVVKRYEVVYRAKARTDDGRVVSRLRQESHPTREAAETRVAELNAHRHSHTTDPAEQRKRGARSLADWSADWLASQRVKVASGQLKAHARRVRPVAGPLRRAGAGTRADCGGDTRAG
jgi:integrase